MEARKIVESRITKGKNISKSPNKGREKKTQRKGLIEGVDSDYQWKRVE